MGEPTKEVFEAPESGKRARRVKFKKTRLHIYINDESIKRIDEKANELGLNRSSCMQVLITYGLNNLKTKDAV